MRKTECLRKTVYTREEWNKTRQDIESRFSALEASTILQVLAENGVCTDNMSLMNHQESAVGQGSTITLLRVLVNALRTAN